jgi:hypothetical protein
MLGKGDPRGRSDPGANDVFGVRDLQGTYDQNYAEENVSAGYWHESEAMKRSYEAHQKLLPQGLMTEGHRLYMARDALSKEAVGYIWIGIEKNMAIPSGFIFAVFIYEKFRGRG